MQIVDWDVIDLTKTPKCERCVKDATYRTSNGCFCKKHVPVLPTLQGLLKPDMETLCDQYGLPKGSRAEMNSVIASFKKTEKIKPATTVELGRALAEAYERFPSIDIVLIENQMAAKMAVVQGMVVQYFVMKGVKTIEIVSPTNKLKGIVPGKTTYAERKKLSVAHTRSTLQTMGLQWDFEGHKKKDDLADTFLQALWYIQKLKK